MISEWRNSKMIVLLCVVMMARSVQSFVQGFFVDETGTYGRDCELYSGSVTSKYSAKSYSEVIFWFFSHQLSARENLRSNPILANGKYDFNKHTEYIQGCN